MVGTRVCALITLGLLVSLLCAYPMQKKDVHIETGRFCMTAQDICDRWNEKKLPNAESLTKYREVGAGMYTFPFDGSKDLLIGIGEKGELCASISLSEPHEQPEIEREKFRARIISLIRWSGCEEADKIREILSALLIEDMQTEREREVAVNDVRYGFRYGKTVVMKGEHGSSRVFPAEQQRAVFWIEIYHVE